jgi:hypothetical protein
MLTTNSISSILDFPRTALRFRGNDDWTRQRLGVRDWITASSAGMTNDLLVSL